jgi:hypothetical protein
MRARIRGLTRRFRQAILEEMRPVAGELQGRQACMHAWMFPPLFTCKSEYSVNPSFRNIAQKKISLASQKSIKKRPEEQRCSMLSSAITLTETSKNRIQYTSWYFCYHDECSKRFREKQFVELLLWRRCKKKQLALRKNKFYKQHSSKTFKNNMWWLLHLACEEEEEEEEEDDTELHDSGNLMIKS